MEWKQPYFLWNNKETFGRGQGSSIQISEKGLVLEGGKNRGSYYTRICDSRQSSMEWDRIRILGDIPYPEDLQISIYTCDRDDILVKNVRYNLRELLEDTSIPIEQKDRLLESCRRRDLAYEKNQLLQGITGRYLWLRLRFRRSGIQSPQIREMQVWFPRNSWVSFLPELYQKQEDSFLERFLGIVQSMYEDMNRKIEDIPGLYDAENTPSDLLVWLSQWLSIPDPYLWKEEQLRYLVRQGSSLAQLRGTVVYLREILQLYTGSTPYIVEYWQWAYEELDSRRRNAMEHLYGSDSFCVTVVLSGEGLQDSISLAVVERLVEHCSPAHLDIRIEILQSCIFLGRHSYLGINSVLKDWSAARLDGQQFLPFVVLKKKEK